MIAPSTNTVVEEDCWTLGVPGVTYHAGRMYIGQPDMSGDEAFQALLEQIRASIVVAIRDVMTCQPDYLMMGMSAETFWGGLEGNAGFIDRVERQSGLSVTTGASACRAGLETLGVSTISFLTPYQPVADEQVHRYFTEAGFDVKRFRGLKVPDATSIAEVGPDDLVPVLRDLDSPDVEAIVQVGTNLSMVGLAAEASRWLGKPVLAINAVTLWHALRANGITTQRPGWGVLWEQR